MTTSRADEPMGDREHDAPASPSEGEVRPAPDDAPALVSVVIPTYNRAELCARAVRSALAQDYPSLEIIVVDDGSSDGTAARLATEFGDRITVLRQANAGVSTARNSGLAAAHGEFITFLDSDDTWHPEKTSRQVRWLEERPDFGMVLCDVASIHQDGSPYRTYSRRERLPRDGFILSDVVRSPSLVPSSAMLRRRVYDTVGGFDASLRTAEDLDLHLRIASREKIGVLGLPLVTCNYGDDLGLSALPCTNRDHVSVVRRFIERNRDRIEPEVARAALFEVLRYNAWSAASCMRPLEGMTYAVGALRHARGQAEVARVLALAPLILKVMVKAATGYAYWFPKLRSLLKSKGASAGD